MSINEAYQFSNHAWIKFFCLIFHNQEELVIIKYNINTGKC